MLLTKTASAESDTDAWDAGVSSGPPSTRVAIIPRGYDTAGDLAEE